LIDAGINLNETSWRGQITLHLITRFANEDIIGCLMTEDLSCLDLTAVDEAEQTPQMPSKTRAASAPVVKAFSRLCTKVADDRS
jgi:hypothetical protein